jgi:hypothetical protein
MRMALAMRKRPHLVRVWRSAGTTALGGVAQGYATIGAIGFEGRGTMAPSPICRLCGEAKGGQIRNVPRGGNLEG